MFHVALYQPEIPPNTGNIIRLCANTGAHLHLIHPLGFDLSDANLRRAGLDYHDMANVTEHQSFEALLTTLPDSRILAFSTRGRQRYDTVQYRPDDLLLFGCETRGLPDEVISALPESQRVCLPMQRGSRSINLSNTVAVTVFEAWRQSGFAGNSSA
ncbi:MAG: tRNA (uridine(34)/cytosine(34)/5-carboxymethylaminomethyluridine(34)-2'-O)-methyltransferase TrmL [Pseudomonadota bacterium]|nr:tRNA (uridine(34)/cytosine(34)/5-carboxymethylaminomethyluridine(34)-2'-O)-methyltransferase TrmL [Pseudomonadota bacterium]